MSGNESDVPSALSNQRASELDNLQKRITAAKEELKMAVGQFPSIPYNTPDWEKGEILLHAFLEDEPFDRHVFTLMPIKIAFLQAAINTEDDEIFFVALTQVRKTLDDDAFNQMLDDNPDIKEKYQTYQMATSYVIPKLPRLVIDERVQDLETRCENAKGLLKLVIEDELERIKTGNDMIGLEPCDLQWEFFQSVVKSLNFRVIKPKKMSKKKKMVGKWKYNMNPMQTAILARTWGYPPEIVKQFAGFVKKENDLKELERHSISI